MHLFDPNAWIVCARCQSWLHDNPKNNMKKGIIVREMMQISGFDLIKATDGGRVWIWLDAYLFGAIYI